ncbi:hypothetical protein [Methanofollis ethanolicus]|uniref:hypothetical protein n=1 Tax=Methanofollis ethanolicus TaxID=488124 RepID=UPI00082CAB12|nr:hypothetical protein [Methanofollis ethanolicus]
MKQTPCIIDLTTDENAATIAAEYQNAAADFEIARKSIGEIVADWHPELEEQVNRASQSFGSQLKELFPGGEGIPPLERPMYNPLEVRR